ncbi:hypothetical protein [Cryptosporangium aurantiacum]|uniref:Thioesterase domain-containing protein n=1 Tax=Cryptosporangium aurantiacum TaxID=134849 RepID=A0A1M7J362_9ACTN|nr:hypothetical protein [Cryptosporangium aurantiacum]SHM47373.1 hypothetical protein SAMN05443668_101671 [Cryptosporangium aurantiacum]
MAIVLPGSASNADFVRRAFGPPLAAAGFCLVTADPPVEDVVAGQLTVLDDAEERFGPALVGGVSLGAHLAVRWAAHRLNRSAARRPSRRPAVAGLLLVMPAWTGEPDAVAGVSAITAADVERDGVAATVERLRAAAPGSWVVDELAAAWPRYTARELTTALRATATSAGPTLAELASLTVPCGVVAVTDDPMHPATVAEAWAEAAPTAALTTTTLAAVGADRTYLGHAAIQACRAVGTVRP